MPVCEISQGLYFGFTAMWLLSIFFSIIFMSIKSTPGGYMTFAVVGAFIGFFVGIIMLPYLATAFECSAGLVP